ncbi:helix-turn-helix domain-containing protein [Chryseobacterium sp. SG20098]|uniref:helix-turn-helix domain-containing protein n=1 Tax=Chryseobacterium sp. SG20098 TaxID=3074145 RepID=UPI002882FE09|nr:helix-turn-helix domain-containing protein [Chryseobacterium sp. SG20098]WNI35963.1 helix-turn-helix domain-containing protein [Chryseobacterium sp. SG20098]WNI36557.1 helix-turn-helix domain-containing protein [Chryseobacterium sp. SG20098]
MKQLQFIGMQPYDLIQEMRRELIPDIKRELKEEFQPKEPTVYLTRQEVCDLLSIDMSTLHRWRKDGVLIAYGLGNRIYFKRNEIETLIEKNRLK